MKDFLKQYCEIIAYALTGLVFAFASFFFIVNMYHQAEISRTFAPSFSTDATMQKYQNSILKIDSNLKDFNPNHYHGSINSFQMMAAHQKLLTCQKILDNDMMKELRSKKELNIVDIYNLRENYENEILGKCVVSNLNWFTKVTENKIDDDYLKQNEKMISLYLEGLRNDTSYLKKELINNSSYYFNTNLVANTIHHNVKDGYYEVMSSYNKVASLVVELSDWFNEEVKEAAR